METAVGDVDGEASSTYYQWSSVVVQITSFTLLSIVTAKMFVRHKGIEH